jgi:outer membrane beta-barrel protein
MTAAALALVLCPARAWTQEPTPPGSEPTPPGAEPTPPGAEPTPPGAEPTPPGAEGAKPAAAEGKKSLGALSWSDILTVPRRPILKYHRVEIMPTYNVSFNSSTYRHHSLGAALNFFLSEALAIGLEAAYVQPQQLEHYFLRGLDDRVLPSVNRYWWNAFANFSYVPVYGKFALFNRWIIQWEAYIQAGLGVIESEWIPRDPANPSQTFFNVSGNLGLGLRTFISKWLAFHVYVKDYLFGDKFEPTSGTEPVSQFVQHVVFGVGLGLFLPTNFEYKYLR